MPLVTSIDKLLTMGKKSKNPRKANQEERASKKSERFLDSVTATRFESQRRAPPSTCDHLPSGSANTEEQRREITAYLGRLLRRQPDADVDMYVDIIKWSTYQGMPELILATAANYVLEYEG